MINATAVISDGIRTDADIGHNITADAVITGNATTAANAENKIVVDASASNAVTADAVLSNTIHVSSEGYADYTGDYEVTSFTAAPLLQTSLVLPTNDKHMLHDMTIYSVPTTEEYNEHGGVTFTIGGE